MDKVEGLRELAALRDNGALSDSEFEAMKSELIGSGAAVSQMNDPHKAADSIVVRLNEILPSGPGAFIPVMTDRSWSHLIVEPGKAKWSELSAESVITVADGSDVSKIRFREDIKCWRVSSRLYGTHAQQGFRRPAAHRIDQGPSMPMGETPRPPKLGPWAVMVVLFGWFGGLVGYFSVRASDQARADHIMRWGLIWTALWGAIAIASYLIVISVVWSSLSS